MIDRRAARMLQVRLTVVRARTVAAVTARWDQLPAHNRAQAEPFARAVAPTVAAGQLVTARATAGYAARVARIAPVAVPRDAVTGLAARRGVDPLDEYQRPLGAVWGALGEGVDPGEAVARGRARAALLAATDVWLAMRAAMGVVQASSDRVNGWVRVADAGACDLCSAADGMPMADAADFAGHPNCSCSAAPSSEPSAAGAEPADVEGFDVAEHGELGPLLVTPGQHFSGPDPESGGEWLDATA